MSLTRPITVGQVCIGGPELVLIAGPCVIEPDHRRTMALAARLRDIAAAAHMPFVFKASYDKANRTSLHAYRGPGLQAGLELLNKIRRDLDIPVLSDIHAVSEVAPAAQVLDMLQIPAFLCRQTDLICAAAASGKPLNIKKGQFLAPLDMRHVIDKARGAGTTQITVTERGVSLGYNNLVVDMRSLVLLRELGCPVVFDATHSVQLPGGADGSSGGERRFVAPLCRAAVAVGIDALFLEVYDDPDSAPCDGPNALRTEDVPELLDSMQRIASCTQTHVHAADQNNQTNAQPPHGCSQPEQP
jgi:2-dehydro-3-deoxyphosphooctonate aldolase (KDO 8-P synthase)